jgi:ISXO2-like transposase domain
VIGAVELSDDGKPPRIRLDRLRDFSATSITGFIGQVVARGATIVSDGLPAYRSLKEHHRRKVVSAAWPPISCCLGCTGCSPT